MRGAQIHAASSWLLRFDDEPITPSLEQLFPGSLSMDVEEESSALFDPVAPEQTQEPTSVDADKLRRTFEEEMAAALQKQQEAHDETLRLARAQWIGQEAEALGQHMAEALSSAFETLRSDVARILAPFVAREIDEMARAELIESTRQALSDEDAPAIRIEGPADLIERIGEVFTARSVAVTLAEADSVDVKIDLSQTRIETRLDAWMRRLNDSRSAAR